MNLCLGEGIFLFPFFFMTLHLYIPLHFLEMIFLLVDYRLLHRFLCPAPCKKAPEMCVHLSWVHKEAAPENLATCRKYYTIVETGTLDVAIMLVGLELDSVSFSVYCNVQSCCKITQDSSSSLHQRFLTGFLKSQLFPIMCNPTTQ